MNEKLSRPQFNQMDTTEKQTLMESLAARYNMTFLDLHTFDRWGQSSTTGIFEKDGRKFVFVPGDTVTLGWEQFAVGLNQESREELEYLFREWEMEPQNPEEMIRESMAPVRQAVIGPMLVGRELEEINWEPVKMDDPRLTAHPDWLKEFRDFAWSVHQIQRIFIMKGNRFRTDHFHTQKPDSLFFAQQPERQVRNARHRCQHTRICNLHISYLKLHRNRIPHPKILRDKTFPVLPSVLVSHSEVF